MVVDDAEPVRRIHLGGERDYVRRVDGGEVERSDASRGGRTPEDEHLIDFVDRGRRGLDFERMRDDPRGIQAWIGRVEPGDVALGEFVRIARIDAWRRRRVVEANLRYEAFVQRVGDDLIDRHERPANTSRPTLIAQKAATRGRSAERAGSVAPIGPAGSDQANSRRTYRPPSRRWS